MTPKENYRILCKTEESIPIFSRDWWLDAVCGADWDVIIIEENDEIVASMTYYRPLSHSITMPFYTQTMGIWYREVPSDMKYSTRIAYHHSIAKQLIDQLPHFNNFLQNFDYHFTDWLPFYWAGFSQTTRYTYVLPNINDIDTMWKNMSSNIRRNITRATEKYNIEIRKDIDIEDFVKVQSMTFQRQGLRVKADRYVLEALIEESRSREQGDLWGAYDKEGNIHAAIFVTWQDSCAYYIAGGGNPDLRESGAHSLLLWNTIKYVSQFTNTYDMEGSMIPGVERFFREFGSIQKPYFTIYNGEMSLIDRVRLKAKRKIIELNKNR